MPATRLSRRVLARLVQAEVCEPNAHYRDDLRIARLTVIHAAKGDAVFCSPHVLASYEVLGLHPDKVWPAIQARQSALGFDRFWGVKLPPKKPPVSAVGCSQQKLWFEKTNAAGVNGSRGGKTVDLRDQTISVPMAAPSIAAAYPNSDHAGRAKERPFFKREELERFFETCPLDVIPHPEWKTLKGMWIAAGKPFGFEIQLFKAIKHYAKGAPYRSESTVRANIRRAENKGFLEVAYRDQRGNCHHIWIRERSKSDRGLYRRVTTHRLPTSLLLEWRSRRGSDSKVEPIRKPAQPTPPPKTPAPARELPSKAAQVEVERKPLRVTRDLRIAIAGCYMNARKQGKDQEAAIKDVSESLSSETHYLAESEVRLQLKIWQSKHGPLDNPPPARERIESPKCSKCQSVLVQNRGPGPRLLCPKCSGGS